MAITRTFAEISGPLGLDRRSVENWLARVDLHTDYEPSRQGVARRFSRDNAVELAMVAALSSIGLEVSRAATYAGALLRHRFQDGGAHEYLTFTSLDGSQAVASNRAPPLGATIRDLPEGDAIAVRVIGQGEILRRVARLYDEPEAT